MDQSRMANGRTISTQESNVVVTIFSLIARTYVNWRGLTEHAFDNLPNRLENVSSEVLDLKPVGGTTLDPLVMKGRVYEIRAYVQLPAGQDKATWSSCKALLNSAGVKQLQDSAGVQVVIQPLETFFAHREPGLAVFDMDSTLIQQEVIDELARAVGRYEAVAAITEAAMRGELDFEQSLRQRVAQLQGVSTEIWAKLKSEVITFTPGALMLIRCLKHLGWKTAVLSGGFTPLAHWVQKELGLDYAYANQLALTEDGKHLSGQLVPEAPIIHAESKRETLIELAEQNNIPIANTIAVGDGSNDILMIQAAGTGIAFNAKLKLQEAAPIKLSSDDMLDLMYVLGYTRDGITEALKDTTAGANGHARANGAGGGANGHRHESGVNGHGQENGAASS